ncbi:MAG: hypothetical protein H7335_02620 [Massilia sp.]|nr:hypothetical protein [Massilia sp.]
MKVFSSARVIAAFIMAFSLLFMQLALASYACPELTVAKSVATATAALEMPGCTNMDMNMEPPGLCHAHCQAGNQSADTPQVPSVQPFVAAQLTMVLRVADVAVPCHACHMEEALLKRSTAPPLAIRHCCFRI